MIGWFLVYVLESVVGRINWNNWCWNCLLRVVCLCCWRWLVWLDWFCCVVVGCFWWFLVWGCWWEVWFCWGFVWLVGRSWFVWVVGVIGWWLFLDMYNWCCVRFLVVGMFCVVFICWLVWLDWIFLYWWWNCCRKLVVVLLVVSVIMFWWKK